MLPIFENEDDARRWNPPTAEFILYRVPCQYGDFFTYALTSAEAVRQVAYWLGFASDAEPMEN